MGVSRPVVTAARMRSLTAVWWPRAKRNTAGTARGKSSSSGAPPARRRPRSPCSADSSSIIATTQAS